MSTATFTTNFAEMSAEEQKLLISPRHTLTHAKTPAELGRKTPAERIATRLANAHGPRSERAHTQQKPNGLPEYEQTIQDALTGTWFDSIAIGNALIAIKEQKLYKTRSLTFGKYCLDRFGFSRMTASRHMRYATVTRALQREGKPLPRSEREALDSGILPKKTRAKKQPAVAQPAVEDPSQDADYLKWLETHPPATPEEHAARAEAWSKGLREEYGDATPVTEDGSATPTMQQNMVDLFHGLGVTVLESMNPGRWLLEDLTASQMRIIAQALKG